jgi:hypothetical protein
MSFLATPNLSSKATTPCTPWTFQAPIPAEVRGKESKKARDKWINEPTTRHQCYTAYEGFIASERIREPRTGDEGNPPLRLHAFVGDYDAPVTLEEIAAGIERHRGLMPNYLERTMSGNARLVWLFEKPISFPNLRFCKEFLKRALTQSKFAEIVVGLDVPAWENPNRLWTNSGEWLVIDEQARIPHALLNGWITETAEKHLWRKDRGAIDIPLPVVFQELQKRWTNLADLWPGDFVEGAQGPSFWIEGSESPKSAIVKPTGLFSFAAHAVKPFYSWADLIGKDFVDRYASEMMGKAVEGVYHDGKTYFRQDGFGDWRAFSKEDVMNHLSVDRGLSVVKDGGTASEVNRAIQYIQNWQGIQGAAPFVYSPPGIVTKNGFKFLNTHTRRVLQPAPGLQVWGPTGNFPFLSKYFSGLLACDEALKFLLSWLSRFYKGAYDLRLESGHNVFLLGRPNVGKTLLSQGILPRLMGGSADAESYLLGETTFNSDLFEMALWTVDDNSATVNVNSHRKFSAMVKKMAANTTFSYHAKFRVPCSIDWLGRVLITANDDEESARIVPDLSISILDKLMLFLCAANPGVVFPPREEMIKILQTELPFFARWLLDYQAPAECVGDSRFGVKAYHAPSLLQVAEQSSRTAPFLEIIEDWSDRFFKQSEAEYWQGNSFQFLRELNSDVATREAGVLRTLNPNTVAAQLSQVKAKGYPIETISTGSTRLWRIPRPEPKKEHSLPIGTKFQK